ncbi:lipase secretion chaperone [Pseudomarimonas arenosa]|uniref:Lipase chaperone n=1 Tax=Pseudomarimonas arenosa TaxID=2774145 RepID=A0AAW3ZP24_9GAMM|nr:lipase secretion chaperone [Pseudomarimonas arenosa]MBD8527713.1 hypothetical protein [Pseudomarimonas arenosa]
MSRTIENQRGRFAALAVALAVLAACIVGRWPQNIAQPPTEENAEPVDSLATAAASPQKTQPSSALQANTVAGPDWQVALAQTSLQGAAIDGVLSFEPNGRLRADSELLRRFDFFLSLSGERSEAEIRRLLLASIEHQYGAVVAAEAEAWFDRYLGLRAELAAQLRAENLSQNLAAIEAAQRRWFGDQADALFAAENSYRRLATERAALLRDSSLTEAERVTALAMLEADLPESVQQDLQQIADAQWANEQSRQFEQLQTSATQRMTEREALFGREAAQRLAALDAERARWNQRLTDYVRQREQLRARHAADLSRFQQALTGLRNQMFSGPELVRVESLELVGRLPVGGG